MENKLLSICIPTYNRPYTLKEMLADLIPKIKKYNIKIYIHDAAPNKEMQEVIDSFDYPYLIYFKSDAPRSADENIKRTLELSDTKYRLLFADHYILYDENSIDEIMKFLTSDEEFDALILHYKNRAVFRNEDFLYTDAQMFLEELGWYIGMAATTIYNEKMLKKLSFEKYYNTSFVQALTILDYISNNEFKIQYIHKETTWNLKNGIKGENSWQISVFEIFAKSWYEGVMKLPNYTKEAKLRCIKNHDKMTNFYSFKNIVLFRFTKGITLSKLKNFYKYLKYTTTKKRIFIMFLISLVPIKSIKYLFKDEYAYIKRVLGGMRMFKDVLRD
jgi:hypothetical protein